MMLAIAALNNDSYSISRVCAEWTPYDTLSKILPGFGMPCETVNMRCCT